MDKERFDPFVTPQREEVVPHYLRASAGSCHDFCKYGRKEAFSEKSKKEKIVKPQDVGDDSIDVKRTFVVKSRSLSFKTPLVSKSFSPRRSASFIDKNIPVKRSSSVMKPLLPDPPEVIKREISIVSENVDVSSSEKSRLSRAKTFSSFEISGRVDSKSSICDFTVSSLSAGKATVPDASINRSKSSICDFTVSKVSARKATVPDASINRSKSSIRDFTVSRISSGKATVPDASINRSKSSIRDFTVSRISAGKATVLDASINPSKKQTTRTMKSGKSKATCDKDVPEKTLHVIKVGTVDDSTKSTSSNTTIPSSSHQKVCDKGDYGTEGSNAKEKRAKESRKTTKQSTPVKLKFRSGKVIELRTETSNPKRIKFRKGITLGGANVKASSRMKSFKKTGESDGLSDGKVQEKVVLKHRKVQGKRSAQGLFNNVIEATASKLVETRKSKVKALVGAFETVISLQEKKPVQTE